MTTAPLGNVRVLDLSAFGPGARATRWLADYGAVVVKIESISTRDVEAPYYAYGGGRGFRRIELDLKSPAGKEALLKMSESADVIIESFRPGVVARLGIDYEAVSARNPKIIYCSISGYGQGSAAAGWVGHDLGYLGVGGYLFNSGRDGHMKPVIPGTTLADAAGGGMHAVMAISVALFAREQSGEGTYLDVSVADGVLALMSLAVDEHLATGITPSPGSTLLTGRYACYGIYRCQDGKDLVVAAIEPRFWRNICNLLGLDQFADVQNDDGAQPLIRAALGEVFLGRTRDEWVDLLAPADTCVAPVYALDEVTTSPIFADRDIFVPADHPEHGRFTQIGAPLAGSAAVRTPVRLERHTTDAHGLLGEAGMTDEEIDALIEDGVVC
ncbi:CaiB/BaiF CoA transferase family protein [Rhodococcus sp. IEGM1428]|uniref:CaiB/BaiF CoA transferase family protein n=1 Tax=Rhodococcus sp. IEGM1428 TaxID=3392191 RepID=UPI003D0D6773